MSDTASNIQTESSHQDNTCNTSTEVDNNSIPYTFDDYYTDSYIATTNKSESYRKACAATGYEFNPEYLKQTAYSYHKRLDKDGSITKALQAVIQRDSIESRLKLISLRDTAKSEQVQLSAAVKTVGSLYDGAASSAGIEVFVNRDNVQIKAGKDTLTIANSDD